jgi:hypothetical protein
MIYLFTGDDSKRKNTVYEKFLKSIPKNIEVLQIGKNDFNETLFESLYSGAGLFFNKSIVVLRDVLENENTREFILKKIKLLSESVNDFAFLEGKLNKPMLNLFNKSKAEIYEFVLAKEKKEKFNNFLLANALGNREKLNLWIYFRMAIDKGVGMEELIGVLFWKAKDMLLKSNFSKFRESELRAFAGKISYLLPESRRDGRDDESAFEQFLLEAF